MRADAVTHLSVSHYYWIYGKPLVWLDLPRFTFPKILPHIPSLFASTSHLFYTLCWSSPLSSSYCSTLTLCLCSIMMTAVSALVAFVAMPFNLWVYTHQWTSETLKVPYTNILASLALVAFPSILGMFIRYKSKKWGDIIKKASHYSYGEITCQGYQSLKIYSNFSLFWQGCGILGWILVVACAAMLLSIYWKVLLNADLRLLAAAALLPGGGCLIAYIVARIICFVSNALPHEFTSHSHNDTFYSIAITYTVYPISS